MTLDNQDTNRYDEGNPTVAVHHQQSVRVKDMLHKDEDVRMVIDATMMGKVLDIAIQRLDAAPTHRERYDKNRLIDWCALAMSDAYPTVGCFVFTSRNMPVVGIMAGVFQQTLNYRNYGRDLFVCSNPAIKAPPHALPLVLDMLEDWCIEHKAEYVSIADEMLGNRAKAYHRLLRTLGYSYSSVEYRKQLHG